MTSRKTPDHGTALPEVPELAEDRAAQLRHWLLTEVARDPVPATRGVATARQATGRSLSSSPWGRALIGAAAVTAIALTGITIVGPRETPVGMTLASGDGIVDTAVPRAGEPGNVYDQCRKRNTVTTSTAVIADANMLFVLDDPAPLNDSAFEATATSGDCTVRYSGIEGIFSKSKSDGVSESALTIWGPDADAPTIKTMNQVTGEVPLADGNATRGYDKIQALTVIAWTFGENSWVITASNTPDETVMAVAEQVQRDQDGARAAEHLTGWNRHETPRRTPDPETVLMWEGAYYMTGERELAPGEHPILGPIRSKQINFHVVRDDYPGRQARLSTTALRAYVGPGVEPGVSWNIPGNKVVTIAGMAVTVSPSLIAQHSAEALDPELENPLVWAEWEPHPGVSINLSTLSEITESQLYETISSFVEIEPDDSRLDGKLIQ